MKFTFQRRTRGGRWKQVGQLRRPARPGAGVVRFRGRFHGHLMKPGRYRVIVRAKRGQQRSTQKVAFKVRKP